MIENHDHSGMSESGGKIDYNYLKNIPSSMWQQVGTFDITGTAGESLLKGDSVCIKSDGLIYKTNSTINGAESFNFIGFATADTAIGNRVTVRVDGTYDGFNGLNPGANYNLNGTAGHIEQARRLIDWYSEANKDSDEYGLIVTRNWRGQAFTSGSFSGQLKVLRAWLGKTGGPDGNIIAHLYASTGTLGVDAKPTGSPLASSTTINCSDVGAYGWVDFTFNTPHNLVASTNYCIVLTSTNSGGSANCVRWGSDASSPSHAGNAFYSADGSTWTASSAYDLCFMLYSGVPITNPTDVGTAISETELKINAYPTVQKIGQLSITAIGITSVTLGFRPQYIQFFAANASDCSLGFADENSNMCSEMQTPSNKAAACIYIGSTSARVFITDTGFIMDVTAYTTTAYVTYIAVK
jgi:hypothetical protein